jgi:hypothetical protein
MTKIENFQTFQFLMSFAEKYEIDAVEYEYIFFFFKFIVVFEICAFELPFY